MDRCQSCFREYDGTVCPYCGGAQNEEHQLPVGTMIRERYKIGRVLGQGGFGITYAAWDTLLDKCVAVKEFYPSGTVFRRSELSTAVECGTKAMVPHYEYSRERFLREARALAKFQDIPEVVGLLDFVKANNTAYIVMEYVRGVDLAKYIRMKGGKLTPQETFRILKPVMEALAKVHKGGIVHRDISPDNIILDPMGGAKLLDFGAVRAVENPDVDKGLNKSTEAILKQGFAPLEQYNTRGSLGPWTDEYAMCATVWYCLTGKVPEEVTVRMAEGTDPDWSTIEGLPEHQRRALEKGISCRARDRYRNMDELLEVLFPGEERDAASAEPITEPEEAGSQPLMKKEKDPSPVKKKAPKSRNKPLLATVVAIVTLIVALAIFLPKKTEPVPSAEPTTQVQKDQDQAEITEPATQPLSAEEKSYLQAEQLLEEGKLGEAAIAFGKLAGYSDARERSFEIWRDITATNSIGAGYYHSVGLLSDGTTVTAGLNQFGQIDSGNWANIISISAGLYHTVGLQENGSVVAVGMNSTGQCDVGSWTNITMVSAGQYHTVGLQSDGSVVSVGQNDHGQCDVSSWTDIVMVCAGNMHTVGIRIDGTIIATGRNGDGQCNLSEWSDIVSISAGGYHTVGLKADGSVVAAGWNDDGRCTVADWSDIIAVDAGDWHTIGLKADGTVVAVGTNDNGQCDVSNWQNIVAVSAGYTHSLGLKADGTVVSVGQNDDGRCDVTDWTGIFLPSAVQESLHAAYTTAETLLAEGRLGEAAIAFGKLVGYADARERSFEIWDMIATRDTVSAGYCHTAGLRADGTLVAVGANGTGQCNVSGWTDIVAVSVGAEHTVGLRADGTVAAVGHSVDGRCDVSGWTDIVAVSAGLYHTVGLRADGTVAAVGWNKDGQCNVDSWTDIVAVSAGLYHTVGLRADGTLVAVGANDTGQCDVSGWTDIVAVSAGYYHTVGLRADGTLATVGSNGYGQCDVSGWTDIVAVSSGSSHTVGLRADGTLVAVGANGTGQCDVSGWTDIVAVSSGSSHTVGLRADGTLAAVGWNEDDQCDVAGWANIQLPHERVPFR